MTGATAMLLAAGRGERLRPLTDHTPKPLIELQGQPLIAHHLQRLAAAGVQQVVINLGWLGEQIAQALGGGQQFGLDIHYSAEPPGALETAGGIHHALALLHPQQFMVISSDVWTDYPLTCLAHRSLKGLAHLVLVDNPAHHAEGDFGLSDEGQVLSEHPHRLTFSGMALFRPALFSELTAGWRPLRPVLEAAIAAGQVTGEHYCGRWLDLGSAERLAQARQGPPLHTD